MSPKKRFITCEICGYRANRTNYESRMFMAKFPLDETRCRKWVQVVGKEDLIYVPIEKLHSLKYVCGSHFDNRAFNKKKNRLRRSAIPSKNLKADPLPDKMLLEFPCHVATNTDFTNLSISKGMCNMKVSLSHVESIAGPSNSGIEPKLGSEAQDYSPDFSTVEESNSNTELLEKSPTKSVQYGPNINENVASSFEHIALTGLDEETRNTLIKEHPIPNNCKTIHAPSLTPEVKSTVTEQVLKQDEAIEAKQRQLAAAISSLGRIISDPLLNSNNSDLVKQLIGTGHLLCDLQYLESLARYENINSSGSDGSPARVRNTLN